MQQQVYCIDDTGTKYEVYWALAQHCADLEQEGLKFEWLAKDDRSFQIYATKSVSPDFIFKVCTSDVPVVILLDLTGVGDRARRGADILKLLEDRLSAQGPDSRFQSLKEAVSDKAIAGLVKAGLRQEIVDKFFVPIFICEAARIFNHTVIIFSNDTTLGEVAAIRKKYTLDGFVGVWDGSFLSEARVKLRRLLQTPEERMLDRFLRECAANPNGEPDKPRAWGHDELGRLDEWLQKAQAAAGEQITRDDAKALFCLEYPKDRVSGVCAPRFSARSDKPITTSALKAVMKALKFPDEPEFSPGSEPEFRLPMQPGIAFLLSLKQMLDCIDPLQGQERSWSLQFQKLKGGPNGHGDVWCARVAFCGFPDSVDHIFRYRARTLAWAGAHGLAPGRLTLAADRVALGQVSFEGLRLAEELKALPVAKLMQSGPTIEVDGRQMHVSVATLSMLPGEIRFYWT